MTQLKEFNFRTHYFILQTSSLISGSWWVLGMPIGDCRLPIGPVTEKLNENPKSEIGNTGPTRYRGVVLTSSDRIRP